MVKVQIKFEQVMFSGVIFSIMEQFDVFLSGVIDSILEYEKLEYIIVFTVE